MYTWNTHYQKEKENFCPIFSEKIWTRKKNYFHYDIIHAAAFPHKTLKFSHTSPFHPQPKQHRIFTLYLCAASWPIKTLKKAVHCTELQ